MKKYTLFILFISSFIAIELSAQDRPYRNFGTLELYKKQKKKDKDSVTNQAIFSHQVNKFRRKGEFEPIQLECVFHVVHNGSEGYVSEEAIWSQIDALNRDFGPPTLTAADVDEQGKRFIDRAVDTEISFCIAADNNGDAEIEYVDTDTTAFTSDDFIKDKTEGGADPIKGDKYINIWIGNLVDTLTGYAQYPGGKSKTDGIVIDYRFFGQIDDADWPYSEGKTLTHLMGNYLGLLDIWGLGQCDDDLVNDTPIHNDPNWGCPTFIHYTYCANSTLEMTMNFMDNTDDACMYMFTMGQKERIHALLYNGGSRHGLDKNQGDCAEPISPNQVTTRSGDNDDNQAIRVYPNPSDGDIYIEMGIIDDDIDLIVNDLSGKVIMSKKLGQKSSQQTLIISSSSWPPGIYFIRAINNQIDYTEKLIIE